MAPSDDKAVRHNDNHGAELDSRRGNTIVPDPFMGSGTTAIACRRTGRRFVGFGIDHGYWETCRVVLLPKTSSDKLLSPRRGKYFTSPVYGSECYTGAILVGFQEGWASIELSAAGDPPTSPIPECRGGIETTFGTAFQSDGMRRQDTKTSCVESE